MLNNKTINYFSITFQFFCLFFDRIFYISKKTNKTCHLQTSKQFRKKEIKMIVFVMEITFINISFFISETFKYLTFNFHE